MPKNRSTKGYLNLGRNENYMQETAGCVHCGEFHSAGVFASGENQFAKWIF